MNLKSGANAVVFANRTKSIGFSVGKVKDIHRCCDRGDQYSYDRRKMRRFSEGQQIANRGTGACLNSVRSFSTSNIRLTVHIDMSKNYYQILGVTPQCSAMRIKQAYYRLSKVYHPDVNKTESAVIKFHELTEAYDVLSSPALRQQYDSHQSGSHHQGSVKHHGVTRGVKSPHAVNFVAKGPHQRPKHDGDIRSDWLKTQYSELLRNNLETKEKKEFYAVLEKEYEALCDEARLKEFRERYGPKKHVRPDYSSSTFNYEGDSRSDVSRFALPICFITVVIAYAQYFIRRKQ